MDISETIWRGNEREQGDNMKTDITTMFRISEGMHEKSYVFLDNEVKSCPHKL